MSLFRRRHSPHNSARAREALELALFPNSCGCNFHALSTANHTPRSSTPDTDYAFEFSSPTVRWGRGVTVEAAAELCMRKAERILLMTDENIRKLHTFDRLVQALSAVNLKFEVFSEVDIEPTDQSFLRAIEFARIYRPDAFISFGGGSVIDTAKAANLYSTYQDAEFLDFVNAPVGRGLPVPGPVRTHIAIPTTSGTGSETTGQAIFDYLKLKAKTGIGSKLLKPTLGLVDPENMHTMPADVAISTAWDVLCHSLESYTAIPYSKRSPRPLEPIRPRPVYQGSNPVSDIWSMAALRLISHNLFAAVEHRDPVAIENLSLAATYAGIGFGNAGVHLCHALSYPISGLNKHLPHVQYCHGGGYGSSKVLVPHGVSVAIPAPAVFRFTAFADPKRHLECSQVLNEGLPQKQRVDISNEGETDGEVAGSLLAEVLLKYMERTKIPLGISKLGFGRDDIPDLVKGSLPQKRLTALSPIPLDQSFDQIFEDSLSY